jgi:predicted dehydrogenase
VVGAGLMGRWHARELVRAGGSLVAVADPDLRAAAAVAGDAAESFSSLEALLSATAVEAVHICAPSERHVELVQMSLSAGCHTLVEKPLAPDAAATRTLLEHAERAARLLCPVHQYLYQRGVRTAPKEISRLGPLMQLDVSVCSAGGADAQERELDDVALDIVPHALAVLERLLPGGLASVNWGADRPRPGELRAHGRAGQAGVSLVVSMSGRPPRNELRAICEHGTLELDFFHGFGYVERGSASRRYKALRPFASAAGRAGSATINLVRRTAEAEPAYPGLRTLIERFYTAARSQTQSPISAEETLAVAAARDELAPQRDQGSPGRNFGASAT